MTETTENIAWPHLILAILLGPGLATTVLLLISAIYPPFFLIAALFATGSLIFGYLPYLVLAGPVMVLAQLLGGDHPLLHAAIGYGAVCLIPFAHSLGLNLPHLSDPIMVEFGQWFGPVWCAAAAAIYAVLRREFTPADATLT